MPQLSIGTRTFTAGDYAENPLGLEAVIHQAAEIGYHGIALGGFPPHGSVKLYPSRRSRRELMRKVRDAGLEVNSYAADLLDCHFYGGSAAALERCSERFQRSLQLVSDCGIPIIRVDTVTMTPYPPDFDYDRAWGTTIEVFCRDAEHAAAAGVTVAWEFEPDACSTSPGKSWESCRRWITRASQSSTTRPMGSCAPWWAPISTGSGRPSREDSLSSSRRLPGRSPTCT
ncbi:MAG: TIM barrel protein [Spirochaetales bacterium]|nr:TIM barrel protein [Spirochaetales bacterium]